MEKSKADNWNDDVASRQDSGHHNGGFSKLEDIGESPYDLPLDESGEKNVNMMNEKRAAEDNDGNTKKKKEPPKVISFFKLFRFADKIDILMIVVATLCSVAHGAALPVLLLVFGDMIQKLVSHSSVEASPSDNVTMSPEEIDSSRSAFMDDIRLSAAAFAGLGGVVLFIAYGQVAFWLMTSHRQTFKMRQSLLRAVLRQEIGWFDTNESGQITSRLSDDVNKIQEGVGDKMGAALQWMSTCISGLIIAFVRTWKLTLVCLSFSPIIAICGGITMKLVTSSSSKELSAYAKAGSIATEVFSCIKTVLVFDGQEKECKRYGKNLVEAKKTGIRKGVITGIGMGLTYFVLYCCWCLAFWYGGKLQREGEISVGTLIIAFFCVITASTALGNASPSLQVISQARGAAYFIWELIDRKPLIDSSSNNGSCPSSFTGNVEFRNISFHYPSRSDVPVLNGLSLKIRSGQTVALVGGSGCGKSTVIQLLQRFYDPLEGAVFVDGNDIRELNIKWLRQHIGVVSQEPVLFAMSIADNIRFGRDGVSQAEIEKAARQANAHSFISELPQKYDTMVGERGAQLSGGQKQRIAIARALVRDPKILLLDEATSALDTESEALVQAALDQARRGRTTIVVAHRLSTVRTADVIYGLKAGRVQEFGTHEELMQTEGIYYQLVTSQRLNSAEEDDQDESEEEAPDGNFLSLSPCSSLRRSRSSTHGTVKSSASHHDNEHGVDNSKDDEEAVRQASMATLMRYNGPEWHYIVLGCISSFLHGGVQPVVAIVFGGLLGVFGYGHTDEDREHVILVLSLMFLVIGFGSGLTYFLSLFLFGLSGEALTMRLRLATFKALLRQDMSFFDNPKNGAGALATRLATDASAVQGATGVRLGMILQALSTIVVGIIIAFIYSWKFALFVFGVMPFILLGAVMQIRLAKGFSMKNMAKLMEAGKTASEAITNIRTVASLNKEDWFVAEYVHLLKPGHRQSMKTAHFFGFAFSFMQAMIFFCDAAIFYFGSWLIAYDGLAYDSMFKSQTVLWSPMQRFLQPPTALFPVVCPCVTQQRVFAAIIFSAFSLGRESQFAPDYGKAKLSAGRILALLEKEPLIDNYSTEGLKPAKCTGRIELKDVEFCYPNRRTVKVMKGTNLAVEPGQTFALVGQTGCGKSTTIQLLERLYDPSAGHVTLDGVDVRRLNLSWLRSQLGLVSQEPVLFDYSIRENIEYGDNSRQVTMDEIIAAARAANIHNFIQSLPNGYETRVGDKGTQLSGGQKQRIAIARALVRNPTILLLDEATSALDTESEKIVQEALDRAQQGRTCIVIAHRLSTIQNANRIIVFQHGRVAEQGTHSELMNLQRGLYYKLQTSHAK